MAHMVHTAPTHLTTLVDNTKQQDESQEVVEIPSPFIMLSGIGGTFSNDKSGNNMCAQSLYLLSTPPVISYWISRGLFFTGCLKGGQIREDHKARCFR